MSLFQRLLSQGARFIPKNVRSAPASLLDTATDPKTYQALAQRADDLGINLPPQFRGAGFQNVPTSALSALDDAAAAPFAGPVRQQVLKEANKKFAREAGSGVTRVPVVPRGGQSIPPVTPTGGANPIVGPIPSRLSPSGGVIPQTGSNVSKNLGGRLNPFNNPKRILNPTGFRGGLLYGTAANTLLPRLGFDQKNTDAITAAVTMPGGPIPKFLAGMVTYDVNNPLAKGTLDSISENLTPEQQALRDKLLKERIAAGSQKATVGNSGLMNLPPSVNTNLAAYDESVTLPNVSSAGNAGSQRPVDPSIGRTVTQQDVKPQVVDTSTQLPASAEQTYIDPYAYQLQVYGQGRNAAQTQSDWDKITKLGLAIHRDKYPQFYNNTSMSYQMRETFPDRSTQSLENSIQEKGVQLPGSMIDADSTNELLGSQEEQRIYQLDEATADVEALLAEIAARKKK